MKIDRRITNGLAWAGVALVVGIPTADLLSAQFMGDAARTTSPQIAVVEAIAPIPAPLSQRPAAPVAAPVTEVAVAAPVVQPAAPVIRPAVTPAAQTADAVDAFLQSGRSLPSYITGAGSPAVVPTQVAVTQPVRTPIITTPAATDPVTVAAIPPQKVAPVPMPLSMRPMPVSVALVRDPVVIPPGLSPAAPPLGVTRPPVDVTAADLEDWESGPLEEFLAQRQAGNAYADPGYDPDGFYLNQGPNQPRRNRVIAREEPFVLFAD